MPFPIGSILDGAQGVKKDGPAYLLNEEIEATIFVSLGNEVLSVARLARVELAKETISLSTHKGERFYFPPDLVLGLKFGSPTSKAIRPGAGFSR